MRCFRCSSLVLLSALSAVAHASDPADELVQRMSQPASLATLHDGRALAEELGASGFPWPDRVVVPDFADHADSRAVAVIGSARLRTLLEGMGLLVVDEPARSSRGYVIEGEVLSYDAGRFVLASTSVTESVERPPSLSSGFLAADERLSAARRARDELGTLNESLGRDAEQGVRALVGGLREGAPIAAVGGLVSLGASGMRVKGEVDAERAYADALKQRDGVDMIQEGYSKSETQQRVVFEARGLVEARLVLRGPGGTVLHKQIITRGFREQDTYAPAVGDTPEDPLDLPTTLQMREVLMQAVFDTFLAEAGTALLERSCREQKGTESCVKLLLTCNRELWPVAMGVLKEAPGFDENNARVYLEALGCLPDASAASTATSGTAPVRVSLDESLPATTLEVVCRSGYRDRFRVVDGVAEMAAVPTEDCDLFFKGVGGGKTSVHGGQELRCQLQDGLPFCTAP